MIRRRRPRREIAFSFDSFLDVVANVVGIIIRLILVAWVGARSYKAVVPPLPPLPALSEPAERPEPTDPRLAGFEGKRLEIASEVAATAEHERHRKRVRAEEQRLEDELAALAAQSSELENQASRLKSQAGNQASAARAVELTLEQLRRRSQALLADLEKLRKLPPARKTLRYQTPVSAPLQSEEVMFECQHGRVTLLDTAALLGHIKRAARQGAERLRGQWEVSDVTPAVGAFRLRYVLARERSALDGPAGGTPLDSAFRYGVAGWEAEAVLPQRGETVEQALKDGSAFRRVTDALDAEQTAVTFWVYPDSFPLYRRLRDHLHARDVVVAGRPLPDGVPIASSRKGTASRGQ